MSTIGGSNVQLDKISNTDHERIQESEDINQPILKFDLEICQLLEQKQVVLEIEDV
jgi:hypothetical protein